MDFRGTTGQEDRPQQRSQQAPDQAEGPEGKADNEAGGAYPYSEADLLAADSYWHHEQQKEHQCEQDNEDEGDGHHGHAQDLAQHQHPAIVSIDWFLLELRAAVGVCRVVVPAYVAKLPPADPAPVRLASTGHVVTSGGSLRRETAPWAALRPLEPGGHLQELPSHHSPFVLRTGGRSWWVRIAVVVAEGAAAGGTAHLCDHIAVLPNLWGAESSTAGAGPQLRVGPHAREAPELLEDLLAQPAPKLLLCGLRVAAVGACAGAAQLVHPGLLDAEPEVRPEAVAAGGVSGSAALRQDQPIGHRDVLQADAAQERLRRQPDRHAPESHRQGLCEGSLLAIVFRPPPPCLAEVGTLPAGVRVRASDLILVIVFPVRQHRVSAAPLQHFRLCLFRWPRKRCPFFACV
mmetsp:Transcript_39029/g.121626  ORF Transcript_39029/g.121626 Transcript_39029/m.121626 type:complete len:404 (-) Transcript_39029:78-1289(-)